MVKYLKFIGILLVLAGCALLPSYKDKNNIMDYVPDIEEGMIYNYDYNVLSIQKHYDAALGETLTDTTVITDSIIEVCLDVEKTENKTYFEIKTDGYISHYIYLKDLGILAESEDTLFDEDSDFVFLKTPVDVETDWESMEYKTEIKALNQTYEKNEILVKDVIEVEINYIEGETDYTSGWLYSPSIGFVREYSRTSGPAGTTDISKDLVRITSEQ